MTTAVWRAPAKLTLLAPGDRRCGPTATTTSTPRWSPSTWPTTSCSRRATASRWSGRPPPAPRPATTTSCAGRCAAVGRTAAVVLAQAHPGRRRPRRGVGRRRRRPALGRLPATWRWPPPSGPTCPSASSAGGPTWPAWARWWSPWPSRTARSPCSRRRSAARPPRSTGPGTASAVRPATARTTWNRPRWRSSRGWREWRDRLGDATGARAGPGRQRGHLVRRGCLPGGRQGRGDDRPSVSAGGWRYFLARRWKRVRLSIFLCFFFRMRLRRFLINEPMRAPTVAAVGGTPPILAGPAGH